jgi:adenylate cyclase 1
MMPPHAVQNKTNNLDSTKRNLSTANGSGSNNNNNNGNGGIYGKKTTSAGSLPSSSAGINNNNNNNNNNIVKMRDGDDDINTNSLKHPVGLEAIKEMTRNKNFDNPT